MKIRKIVIRSYRGIEEQSIDVAPSGAVVKGRNGSGKTTVINAVRAALEGRDIAADAIRKGSAKGEILIDIDDLSVRRAITAKGNTLAVTKDGMQAKAPQTFLRDLLGTSSLDPMDLLTKKGKDRRALVLAALPVTVTVEQIRQWCPRVPDNFDCSGHGLEVIERVRAKAYDQRAEANKVAKTAKIEMDRLDAEAAKAAEVAPPDCFEANLDQMAFDLAKAKRRVVELTTQQTQALASFERTAQSRAKVDELRAKATATRKLGTTTVSEEEVAAQHGKLVACIEEVERLKTALEEADRQVGLARKVLDEMQDQNECAASNAKEATDLDQQANDLEATIAAASVECPSQEAISQSRTDEYKAQSELDEAARQLDLKRKASEAKSIADNARNAWDEAAAEAARLDGIVRALTEEAPAALLTACDGIPGVALDGDDVMLDGVKLDALCGAEQVRFCVEVARRANAKSKILIVDGLERLDDEQMDVFIHEATRDGWQLLGTRVSGSGGIVIEAIEPDARCTEAAE